MPTGFGRRASPAGEKAIGEFDVGLLICDEDGAGLGRPIRSQLTRGRAGDCVPAKETTRGFEAVVVNSRNANGSTGGGGLAVAEEMSPSAASGSGFHRSGGGRLDGRIGRASTDAR